MQIQFQRLILASFLIGALVLGGCDSPKRPQSSMSTPATSSAPATSSSSSTQFPGLPRLDGMATVVMTLMDKQITVKGKQITVKGKQITIEVNGTNAPISAGNFVDLVQKGFYNGLTFHRVVREPQPFVVQGGDPKGNGTGGYIPSGSSSERRIPLEIKSQDAAAPTYSEPITGKPVLQHKRGAIAMARSQSPDSASSQFYFTLADVPFLDGSYAVFGKITKGLEVIDTIKQGDKITSAKVTQGANQLKK